MEKQINQQNHQHTHVHTKDCNHSHDPNHKHDHNCGHDHTHNHPHTHNHGHTHQHNEHNHNHNHLNQGQVNEKDQLTMIVSEEYQKALHFYSLGKFRISHEFFKRTIEAIKNADQEDSSDHVQVLKKMVNNQILLKLYHDAENTLEEIIEIFQKKSTNETLIYKEYNNLFLHCLKYNLNKAIILGKALLSEKEKKNIPVAYQKIFAFNLGTAYLLKGNFVDAKQRLRECIVLDPNPLLRGFALNNLAVSCWWHKHPSFRNTVDIDEEEKIINSQNRKESQNLYSLQQIDADFDNVIPLFKKSMWYIENVDSIKELSFRTQLKQLLDQEKLIPADAQKQEQNMILTKQECGTPLMNIQEFILHTNPLKRTEATFWFKYALKFYETVDPNNMEKCIINLAIFCSNSKDYDKAEGLFKQALEMIGDSDNYNKIICLQMYGNLLLKRENRQKEGEQLIAEAHKVAELLPYWFNKLNYVIIPKLDLS